MVSEKKNLVYAKSFCVAFPAKTKMRCNNIKITKTRRFGDGNVRRQKGGNRKSKYCNIILKSNSHAARLNFVNKIVTQKKIPAK